VPISNDREHAAPARVRDKIFDSKLAIFVWNHEVKANPAFKGPSKEGVALRLIRASD
jgi:hypothetical protein